MRSCILERETGACHQILYRLGDEDLSFSRKGGDTSADMYGDPLDMISDHLDLACMKAGPDLQPHPVNAVGRSHGASDGSSGAVERGKEPVARGLDLATVET